MDTQNIVILASGSGSNAENIAHFFKNDREINIAAVFTNKAHAGVIERIKPLAVPVVVFDNADFTGSAEKVMHSLQDYKADYIVLAGFLRKIPSTMIEAFPNKIINIHPALLPKFGGKGMYGAKVHQAVFDAKESKSGITVHVVSENYDEGAIIEQRKCAINDEDTPKTIETKVRQLEIEHFPQIIASFIKR